MTIKHVGNQSIRYGDEQIDYRLARSAVMKGSVRITVDPIDGVTVLAPSSADDTEVRDAVRRRAKWIYRHFLSGQPDARVSRSISGEPILYLGRRYMLKVLRGSPESGKLLGGQLRVTTQNQSAEVVRSIVNAWYSERALQYFGRRLALLYDPQLDKGNSLPELRLRRMKRQWGNCSPAGRISLNPILVQAPRECIDYVILHELCHRRFHNHGRGFKRLLATRMPDWVERKELLEFFAQELLKD